MADQIEITVSVKRNGYEIAGFPYRSRLLVDESQSFSYEKATGGGYAALPANQIETVQVLVLTADQVLTARLDGQSDAGIILSAGGLLLVVGATIDAGVATNATIDNSSGAAALVRGLAAGT